MGGKSVLITGGCGFIGSHLVDALIAKGNDVTVLDNLSSSTLEYIRPHIESEKLRFVKGDVRDFNVVSRVCSGKDVVFHFAAQPDVRLSLSQPLIDFDINVRGTLNIIEGMKRNRVPLLVFASTSTVYGQASIIPTPENYPINPISNYGASKSACEVYMMSFSSSYGMTCVSLRYANIFGVRSNHGVVHDFFQKLKKDPSKLEILGDGKQVKSYLYITDCIEASLLATEKCTQGEFGAFNIGSTEQLEVNEIAKLVIDQLRIEDIELSYTGGKQGWVGDVTDMLLDTKKIRKFGWQPAIDAREGIRRYVAWLAERWQEIKD